MPEPVDTLNRFGVCSRGETLALLFPPFTNMPIQKEHALVLAAYLVSLADPGGERFQEVLKAVQNA